MSSTLGLIAGNGRLPFEVAEAAQTRGLRLAILALIESTDPRIESYASEGFMWVRPGELTRMIEFFKKSAATEVILAGGVTKSRLLRNPEVLGADERTLKMLARLDSRGDDAVLRGVASEFEAEGLVVVHSTRYIEDRLTPEGPLTQVRPSEAAQTDLELGLRVAKTLGQHDVGQSVVIKDGAVLAVEAVEGTDATIRRAAEVGGEGAVLVKTAKPAQDLRFDVPAVGPRTIELAHECHLVAIGLEAERTILLERARTLEQADRRRIAMVGFRVGLP